jgi:TonB family protein
MQMKKYLFPIITLVLLISSPVFSQESEEVFTFVEHMPVFPGGDQEMHKFLVSNIKYPKDAMEANVSGVVYVKFIVGHDGVVRNHQIVRSVNKELDAEALRVVKLMPVWTAGTMRGKPVNVQFVLPIRFKLSE